MIKFSLPLSIIGLRLRFNLLKGGNFEEFALWNIQSFFDKSQQSKNVVCFSKES